MPKMRAPAGPPSCSTAHLARRLGVSVPTVQRWVDLGHLKAWKTVGGHRRIDAESAEDFIRLQARQRGAVEGAAALPAVAGTPWSVLVVDGDPDDRQLLRVLVQAALPGARIVVAANGFEALIQVGRAMPDLIVADVSMPHMDGVQMIRHLATRDARSPAIVVVSSAAAHLDKLDPLPAGVALLAKPADPEQFLETVQLALRAG